VSRHHCVLNFFLSLFFSPPESVLLLVSCLPSLHALSLVELLLSLRLPCHSGCPVTPAARQSNIDFELRLSLFAILSFAVVFPSESFASFFSFSSLLFCLRSFILTPCLCLCVGRLTRRKNERVLIQRGILSTMGRDLLKVPERNNNPNGMCLGPSCFFFSSCVLVSSSLFVVAVFRRPGFRA
jgi:hypothetical protein